jgi:diadenosine tetraphosphate (Ap4A) HIT family hydrolase
LKHQYFGDINDYRKYGLLRLLSNFGEITTSVCWMLTPDTERNPDGQKLTYLDWPEKYRLHDPALFDLLLEKVRHRGIRNVNSAFMPTILPNSRLFNDLVPAEQEKRSAWFESFLKKALSTTLVFFDPDNGLEVSSCRKGAKNSSKYLYWDEVGKAYKAGSSVLIYQHFQRVERNAFIRKIVEKAEAETGAVVFTFSTAHVVFFLLARPEHAARFREADNKISQQWRAQIAVSPPELRQEIDSQTSCPFCNPNNSRIITANDHAIVVYDAFPVTPGHILIIPKRHIASFFDATREEQTAMLDLLTKMRKLLQKERNPDGFNIGINDGVAAGQTVMHLHIHLIPRYSGDKADPRGGVRWIMPEKAPYWKNL